MTRRLIIIFFLIIQINLSAQIPEHIYFLAGSPIRQCAYDETGETFISKIFKYSVKEGLTNEKNISDSSEVLFLLKYYPIEKKIISLSCKTDIKSFRRVSGFNFNIIDVPTFERFKIFLDKDSVIENLEYYLYNKSIRPLKLDSQFIVSIEYHNNEAIEFSKIITLNNKDKAILRYSDLNRSIINGSMAGPFFGSNSDILPLQAHPTQRLLVIPSYLKEDSVFFTKIPDNAILTPKRYSANVIINTDQIRLMYYYRGEDDKPFYDLYNKVQDRYYQFPFDNSNQNVKQFGNWIAGPTRLQYVDRGTFQGEHPGQESWNPNHNKYGLAVAEYVDRNLKKMILSGYLAIRNINDPSIFIEWDTRQGDSEILNIIEGIIYYRKHDEIWYVPIIENIKLGAHKMLLKDKAVPGIHFMFVVE